MKEIIVLGGGFGGISAALAMLKNLSKDEANITLIDRNSYHLFTASLYEVATREETQKNVAIPLPEIFENKINIVKGEVTTIDAKGGLVNISGDRHYAFDYLLISLGSEPVYFDIEGLKEFSYSMKALSDAIFIKKKIQELYHKKAEKGEKVKVIVGGGGFTGTELTAELVNYRDKLAKHHKRPKTFFDITIIQGSPSLLKELDEKVSKLAEKRLGKFGVEIVLNSHIEKVTQDRVETDGGASYPYDFFIWTGGIKANKVLADSGFKVDGRGQVDVNEKMQVAGFENIFAIGDNALYANPTDNKPVPQVAQVAEDQGKIAGLNIARSVKGQDLKSYNFLHLGYIIPIKGRFAVADLKNLRVGGFIGWILQQLVFLNYLLRILPLTKALKRWNRFEMYLNENIN